MANFSKPVKRRRGDVLSKHYWVRVYDGGRRTWRSTGKESLALAKEVVMTWHMRDAKGDRHVEDKPFSEAVNYWLLTKESRVSRGCYTVYKSYVGQWVREFKSTKLRALEPSTVELYFRRRKASGVSSRSLNNERATLRSFLLFAQRNGWVLRSPIDQLARFPVTKRSIRTLAEAEEKRLLEECRRAGGNCYSFVLALLCSGLRRGTVAQLEWSDVDFEKREWQIPASKMKSREDFNGRPIAKELFLYLKEHRKTSGLIFGKLSGKRFRQAIKNAGLPWLRPHDLRRNFVTRCRKSGVPLEVTMRLSDHRDIKVVLDCYREVMAEELQDGMRKVFGGE